MPSLWSWPNVGKKVSGNWGGGSRLPSFLCFTERNLETELMEEVERKVTELKIKEVENNSLKMRLAKERSTRMELEQTAKHLASSLEGLMTVLEEKEGVNGGGSIGKPRLEKLGNKKGRDMLQGKESKDRFGGRRIKTAEKSVRAEVEQSMEIKYLRDKLEKERLEKDALKKRVDEFGEFLRHWHADFMKTRSAYKVERKLRMALQVENESLREQLQQERRELATTDEAVSFANAGHEFEEQGKEIESGLSYRTSEPSETPFRDSQALEGGEQQQSIDHGIARTVETGGTCGASATLQLVSDEEGASVPLQSVSDGEGNNLGSWNPGKQTGMVERSRAESVGNGDGNGSEKAVDFKRASVSRREEVFALQRLLTVEASRDLGKECGQSVGPGTGKAEEETGVGAVKDDTRGDGTRGGASAISQAGDKGEMQMAIPERTDGGVSMGLPEEVTSTEGRELSSCDCRGIDTMEHLEAERESFGTNHEESKAEGTRFVRTRGLPQAVLKEITAITGGDGKSAVATMNGLETESFVTTDVESESEERGTGLVRTRGLPQAILNGTTVTIRGGERECVKRSESGKALESGNTGIASREDSGPTVKIVLRETADLLLPVPQEIEAVQLGKDDVHLESKDGEGMVLTAAGNARSNTWREEVMVPVGGGKKWQADSSAVAHGEKVEKMQQISSSRTLGPSVRFLSTVKALLDAQRSSAQRLQWRQPGLPPLLGPSQQAFQGMQSIPEDLLLSDKLSMDLLSQPGVSSSDQVRLSLMGKLQGVSMLLPRGSIVALDDKIEERDVGEEKDGFEEKSTVAKDSSEDVRTAPGWQTSSRGMNSFLSRGVFAPVMREAETAGGVSNTTNVGSEGVSVSHQLNASMSDHSKIEGPHFAVHRVSLSAPSEKPVSSSSSSKECGDCELPGSVSTICPRLEGESVVTSGERNEEDKEIDKQNASRQSGKAGGPNSCDAAGKVWCRTDTPGSYFPNLETVTGGSLPPGPPSAIRGGQLEKVDPAVVDLRSKLGMEVSTRIKLERQLDELKSKLLESLSSNSELPGSRTLLAETTPPSGIADRAHFFSPIRQSEMDLLTSNRNGSDSTDHTIRKLEAMISELNDKVSSLTEELESARETIDNISQSRDLSLMKVASLRGKLGAAVRINGKLQTMFAAEAH